MSLLRRRLMADMPKTEPKWNVVKVVLLVTVEDSGNAPIFDVGFDISQVKYIRLVDDGREFDISHTLDLHPGEYKLEIGLNVLTNGDLMFFGVNLLYCDFSDVDISNMYSGRYMFAYTNIDKPPFFSLPDVRLTSNCFEGMFMGCASLVYAPVLPSKTLVDGCYKNMFNQCNSLIFIKALFQSNPNENPTATEDWTLNVASEGTFVMSENATFSKSDFRGTSGIPEQWSVVSSDELVNGKVVNNLSIYYGTLMSFGASTKLESQYPVTSQVYCFYQTSTLGEEIVYDANGIEIGDKSSIIKYFTRIPFIDIVSGPKEDDCFIYELPDAMDGVELITYHMEAEYGGTLYAEKGMTWGQMIDSRYNITSCHSIDGYVYYGTGIAVRDSDGNNVLASDVIESNGQYTTYE